MPGGGASSAHIVANTNYSRLERWHDACCCCASMNALLAPRTPASSPPSSPAFPPRAVRAWRRARCRAPTAVRGLLSRATVRGRRHLRGRAGERRVRSPRGALRGDHPVGLGGGHAPAGTRFAAGVSTGSACGRIDRDAAGDGADAHRGDLTPHRGAGLSRRHHPPAADAVRPVPAPVRGVLPAGPRLPGGRHGGQPRAPAPAPRHSSSCLSAPPSTILARWCPTAPRLASMRRGYEEVLDYERTCLIGSASPFRYFRVSAKDLTR